MRARRENAKPSLMRRALACLVSAAMVMAFTPVVAWGAEPQVVTNVPYLDASGASQNCGSATVVEGSTTTWNSGWYVVSGTVEIGNRITVSGNVHLILANRCNLNATIIYVTAGNSLTIYGQSDGTGTLTATTSASGWAGICTGFATDSGGAVTINGGNITATGAGFGAGIGGGYNNSKGGHGGTITINGGKVTANGGVSGGAGIGGGGSGKSGSVTINGGEVAAYGSHGASGGAGISSGTVRINGGKVTATGKGGGAGIGGGTNGSGGTVTINGGTVKASGTIGNNNIGGGAGIGGGTNGSGGTVIITSGEVTATGSNGGKGIGGGRNGNSNQDPVHDGGTLIHISGTVNATDNATAWIKPTSNGNLEAHGAVTPPVDLAIPSDKTLTIPSGTSLTVPDGKTLTNKGIITNNGTLDNNGTITNSGTITIDGGTLNNTNGSIYMDAGTISANGAVYYPLTLKPNGGTINVTGDKSNKPDDSTTIYGKVDGKITLSASREGYSVSWYVGGSSLVTVSEDNKFTMPNEAVTVAAIWKAEQYTITFESNDGSEVPSITKDYGTKVTKPAGPTKDGYTFAGWYKDSGFTSAWDFTKDTMPAKDITLYAKWLSSDSSVKSVAVKGVDAAVDNAGQTVEVTLPYNVALPTVGTDFEIVTTSDKAQKTQPVKDGNVWKFVVTAEDGKTAEYVVTVKQQPAPYVPPTYNVPGSGEGSVAVKVTVSGSTAVVAEISALALVSAAGSGAESITIDLSGLPKGVTQAQLTKTTVDKLLAVLNDKDNAVESVTVNLGGAVLTLDAKALAAVAEQVKGTNVTLGVKESTPDSLNSAQRHALSPFEVVQLYFVAEIKSGGVEIHDFGGGSVRVSVAFEPRAGHNPARYVVLYVGEDGSIERYATAWAGGMLSFMAPHFSTYAVVYVEDATQAAIQLLEAVPDAGKLKTSQAKEAVKKAKAALAEYAALDDGQKMLVDEALIANAESVVKRGNELVAAADKKAVGKVKNKAFSVKAGKSKSIAFKTKVSAAGTKVVYKKTKGSKYITVTKSGKVTAKKGMKKGKTYTAKVKVTCGKATKTVKITVRVR